MTLNERRRLQRIYAAINAVPGAGLGGGSSMSASAIGVISYANDMRIVTGHCQKAMAALFMEPRHVDFSKEEQDELYEEAMADAEKFVAGRRSNDWRPASQR